MIGFNHPYMTGAELENIKQAHKQKQLAGDGYFTKECEKWLNHYYFNSRTLITNSCTASLETTALLLDIKPGDEVIMPSYTFVSTANAFALRGAIPRFVDIDQTTLNINPLKIKEQISAKTVAIVVVHYAGVACDMDRINEIGRTHNIPIIEDAAQAFMAEYKGQKLGSIGSMGALSFHETKNIISGEGGALIINDLNLIKRAEIIREKGTDRAQFFRGEVDKYSWRDIGSSYLPGEIITAFLYAQLEKAEWITKTRLKIWQEYLQKLKFLDDSPIDMPNPPEECKHNGHIFFLIMPSKKKRDEFIDYMRGKDIHCVFHYIPLHSSSFYKQRFNTHIELPVTESISERIVRLPLWIGIEQHIDYICSNIQEWYTKNF